MKNKKKKQKSVTTINILNIKGNKLSLPDNAYWLYAFGIALLSAIVYYILN